MRSGAFSDEVDTGSSKKMRPNQKARALIRFHRIEMRAGAFSDEVDAGSSKKMRPKKKLERQSDSIRSAL